jgi:transposase-like protein
VKTEELQDNGEAGFSPAPERGAVTKGIGGWPDPEVAGRPVMRHFSAAYKRRIVEEAARCQVGEVGALLRREGLYSSALTRWRKQYAAGVLAGLSAKAPGHQPRPAGAMAADVARLERENRRLQRRLEKAELIITFQKKPANCWGSRRGPRPRRTRSVDGSGGRTRITGGDRCGLRSWA